MVFQEDQTLGHFDKAKKSKGTSYDFVELVPIPPSLKQLRNEQEEIDEVVRDDSASDIPTQELIEHEEQKEHSPHQEDLIPQTRRYTREHHPFTRYHSSDYRLVTNKEEPLCFQETKSYEDSSNRLKAMQDEMNSLQKKETYELVQLP